MSKSSINNNLCSNGTNITYNTFQIKIDSGSIEAVRIPQFGKITTDQLGRLWVDWSVKPIEHSANNLPKDFGGGIVIVPVLYHLFTTMGLDPDVRMHVAVGTSLATIIATSALNVGQLIVNRLAEKL